MKTYQHLSHTSDLIRKVITFATGLTVLLLASGGLFAQTNMRLAPNASLTVEGTSTMHDWHMSMEKVQGSAAMTVEEGKLSNISGLNLSMLAEDLKSEKKAMDNNAYKALKTDEHENIKFSLTKVKEIKAEGQGYQVATTGNLTVAGTTKPVDITALCAVNGDGTVNCKGSTTFKMTDFGVEPPSFMFGTITTGDEITIKFDVNFAQQSN